MNNRKQSKGKGNFGNKKQHQVAGRKGGFTTKKKYGREHFSKIGRRKNV